MFIKIVSFCLIVSFSLAVVALIVDQSSVCTPNNTAAYISVSVFSVECNEQC